MDIPLYHYGLEGCPVTDSIYGAINPPTTTTRVKISQNFKVHASVSTACTGQTLSNLMCSKYINQLKRVNCF